MSKVKKARLIHLYKNKKYDEFNKFAWHCIDTTTEANKLNILSIIRVLICDYTKTENRKLFNTLPGCENLKFSKKFLNDMRQQKEDKIAEKGAQPIIIKDEANFYKFFAENPEPIIRVLFLTGRRLNDILSFDFEYVDDITLKSPGLSKKRNKNLCSFKTLENAKDILKQINEIKKQKKGVKVNSVVQYTVRKFVYMNKYLIEQNIVNKNMKPYDLRSAYNLYAYKKYAVNISLEKFTHDNLNHINYDTSRTYINNIMFEKNNIENIKEQKQTIVKPPKKPKYTYKLTNKDGKTVKQFLKRRNLLLYIFRKNKPPIKPTISNLYKFQYIVGNSIKSKQKKPICERSEKMKDNAIGKYYIEKF